MDHEGKRRTTLRMQGMGGSPVRRLVVELSNRKVEAPIDEGFPYQKHPQSHKERSRDMGVNQGGVAGNYLAKIQNVTESFQNGAHNGRFESQSQYGVREPNRERESPPLNVPKRARISPTRSGMRSLHEEHVWD
jgi:hypothetical protein